MKKRWFYSVAVTAMVTCLACPPVQAQDAGQPESNDPVLDEIVVTAQHRAENLQKVGISITAFSGEQMRELGISKTTDIVAHTPNMHLYQFSPSNTVYNLRGISQNSFADHLEAPVAVYVDGAYVSALGALSAPLYDLERVEVLRGPQGTLYGRNVTGGLIHYITQKPSNEFSGYFTGTYGNFDRYEIEGAAGGPVVRDKVMARFAVKRTKADGYMQSQTPGVRDAQGEDSISFRGALDVRPTERLSILAIGSYTDDNDVPTGAYVITPARRDPSTGLGIVDNKPAHPWQFTSDYQGFFNRHLTTGTVRATWEASDAVTITSISNILRLTKSYGEDADGTDVPIFNYGIVQRLTQKSQELRADGHSGAFKWQAGAYYLDIKSYNLQSAEGFIAGFTNAASGIPASQVITDYNFRTRSWSVFAQGDLQFTDTLTLTVGARYTHDSKSIALFSRYQEADGTVLLAQSDVPGLPIGPVCYSTHVDPRCPGDTGDSQARQKLSDWSGKVQLTWTPSDNALVYGSVSRGIKGGNWSAPLFPDAILANGLGVLPHGSETLHSYEVGAKTSPVPGMHINVAAFYYDYKNYQAFSLINYVQSISNNDATIKGAEIEWRYQPTRGLNLSLGAAFLDTKVHNITAPSGILIDTQMPQSPHVAVNGSAKYEFDALGGKLFAQGDFVYNGRQFMEVTNAPLDREPSYLVGNVQVGYEALDSGYRVAFWMKNVGNKAYRIYALDNSGAPTPFAQDLYSPPRTYGVTATVNF